jgi:hypothetical protein
MCRSGTPGYICRRNRFLPGVLKSLQIRAQCPDFVTFCADPDPDPALFISQRHGSADPDPDPDPHPHQNVMDPQHWWTGSRSQTQAGTQRVGYAGKPFINNMWIENSRQILRLWLGGYGRLWHRHKVIVLVRQPRSLADQYNHTPESTKSPLPPPPPSQGLRLWL